MIPFSAISVPRIQIRSSSGIRPVSIPLEFGFQILNPNGCRFLNFDPVPIRFQGDKSDSVEIRFGCNEIWFGSQGYKFNSVRIGFLEFLSDSVLIRFAGFRFDSVRFQGFHPFPLLGFRSDLFQIRFNWIRFQIRFLGFKSDSVRIRFLDFKCKRFLGFDPVPIRFLGEKSDSVEIRFSLNSIVTNSVPIRFQDINSIHSEFDLLVYCIQIRFGS